MLMTNRRLAEQELFVNTIQELSNIELAKKVYVMCEQDKIFPCVYCSQCNECNGCFVEDEDCIKGIIEWLEEDEEE